MPGYVSLMYYAFYDSYGDDLDAFERFCRDNARTAADVEDLCFNCDLSAEQWTVVQMCCVLPKSVMLGCRDRVHWEMVTSYEYGMLDDRDVAELKDYVSWPSVFAYSKMVTEGTLAGYVDYVTFNLISKCRNWSDEWLWRFRDRMNWWDVTRNRIEAGRIDDAFLERFRKRVNWEMISKRGECLTAGMVRKYADFLDWRALSISRHWSDEEKEAFADRIDFGVLFDIETAKARLDEVIAREA